MSRELLVHLAERYAFDGSPGFSDLGVYHVPFDALVGGTAVEAHIRAAVGRGERVVLLADSGGGKSSVISHVLGPTAEGLAPVVVPVHALEAEATRPERVADELLAMLARYAQQIEALDEVALVAGPTRQVTRSQRHSSGVGLALGWFRGDLATDVVRQVRVEQPISLAAKTEVLDQAFASIHRHRLQPVIVFDDTDRWLSGTDSDTVSGFFRTTMRWLTELPVSVVVAAHHHYVPDRRAREQRLEFLDTRIEVPSIPSAAALSTILAKRVTLNVQDSDHAEASLAGAIDGAAVEALFEAYQDGDSVRRVMQLCHIALAEAVSAEAEVIAADDITAVRLAS